MSMRLAVNHINNRDATLAPAIATLQNDFQVEYVVQDCRNNAMGALGGIVELQKRLGGALKVVLGPNGSGPSQAASPFLSVFGVPMISWGATSADLSNKATYPNFFRVVAPDSFRFKILVEFIAYVGFRRMNVAYVDDAFHSAEVDSILAAITRFNAASASFRLEVENRLKVNSDGEGGPPISVANQPQLRSVLDTLRRSPVRVNIVCAINEAAYSIFGMALELGMVSPGYVWLGGDGLAGSQFAGKLSRVPACHGSIFINSASQGATFSAFQSLWSSMMAQTQTPEFDNFTDVCTGGVTCASLRPPRGEFLGWTPGVQDATMRCSYTELAYDAMLVLVKVADELLTKKKKANSSMIDPGMLTAADWMAGMKSLIGRPVAIEGLSGPIFFDENQERALGMTFANWHTGSLSPVVVATWSAIAGFEWRVGAQMFWPGFASGQNITSASVPPVPQDTWPQTL